MKKFNLVDWAFSTLLVGNVLQLFIPSSNDLSLAIAPAIAAAAITVGGSLLGGMFGRRKPPVDPYAKFYGMGAESAYGLGQRLTENPYGIGEEGKLAMRNTARDTFSAGHQMLNRQRDTNFARSGLDQAGGSKQRQDYYAANQFSEGLNTAYNRIEALDAQMKDAQRARGENIMMALANKNPIYSQLSAQNYWQSLNDQNQFNQTIGQSLGSWYDNWSQGQNQQQSSQFQFGGMNQYETFNDYNSFIDNNTSSNFNDPYGESAVTSADPYGDSHG